MNHRIQNIEERLANRRDQAWARSMMSRMSTLAGRAPAGVPGERPASTKPVALILFLLALVSLWATALGMGH